MKGKKRQGSSRFYLANCNHCKQGRPTAGPALGMAGTARSAPSTPPQTQEPSTPPTQEPSTPPTQSPPTPEAHTDRSSAERFAELLLRGNEQLGFGGRAVERMTWREAWRLQGDFEAGWVVEWALNKGRARPILETRDSVISFAAWCEMMQDVESRLSPEERGTFNVGRPRPRCPTHGLAMDGPKLVRYGQPQNRGRLYFACQHSDSQRGPSNPCGNRQNSENEGSSDGYSLGFLWVDGTEPNGTVAKERAAVYNKRKREEEEAALPTMARHGQLPSIRARNSASGPHPAPATPAD